MERLQCTRTISFVTLPKAVGYDIVTNATVAVRKADGSYIPGGLTCSLYRTVNGVREAVGGTEAAALGSYRIGTVSFTPTAAITPITAYSDSVAFPLTVSFVARNGTVLASATVSKSEEVKGETGASGAVMRVREWNENLGRVSDGSRPIGGVRWLDVVYVLDSRFMPVFYKCILPHVAGPINKPGVSEGFWEQLTAMGPIYTPALFAENAHIRFMSGQEIVLLDKEGKIFGRFGAPLDSGSVMHMGGEQPSEATFNLTREGTARFGLTNGPHIELNGKARDILVHGWLPLDSAGTQNELGVVARFTGQNVTVPAENATGLSASVNVTTKTWTSAGNAIRSQDISLGTLSANLSQLIVSVPVKLTTANTGYVPASGNPDPGPIEDGEGGGSGTGSGTASYVEAHTKTAEIQVFAELVLKDSNGGETVYSSVSRSIKSDSVNRSESALSNLVATVSNAPAGAWYLRLRCIGSISYKPSDTAIPSWTVQFGNNATVTCRNVRFSSIYGKGGFYAGTSSLCHVAAISNCNPTASGTDMMFEALSKGTGIKVENGGLFTRNNNSAWVQHPIVILNGSIWNDNGTWKVNGKGFDNMLPVLTRDPNTGHLSFKLTFPTQWTSKLPITAASGDKFSIQVTPASDTPAMVSGRKTAGQDYVMVHCSQTCNLNVTITYYP